MDLTHPKILPTNEINDRGNGEPAMLGCSVVNDRGNGEVARHGR